MVYTVPMSETTRSHGGTTVPRWDGALYAANTAHHRAHDHDVLASFPVRPTDRVLDVGCGAGDFTATVAALVPDGVVVGVDPEPTMLEIARRVARPNQRFELASAQTLTRAVPGARFDAVFSRAVFHWIPVTDLPAIYHSIRDLLNPQGWFRLECGGAGNVPHVVDLLSEISACHGGAPSPWSFIDPGRHLELLEPAGFELGSDGFVRSVAQRRPFTRESLLGWLHSQCLHGFDAGLSDEARAAFRGDVASRLDELRRVDGSYDQTFVRIDVLVYRR